MFRYALCLGLFLVSQSTYAWEGQDAETGAEVEIEKGQLVRPGREIEYYDHESGEHRYGDVESMHSYGNTVEVEVYDQESGEYRTFDMEE